MTDVVDDTETFLINVTNPGWDGYWHPENQTYNTDGITVIGENIEVYYTKNGTNEYTLHYYGNNNPPYDWKHYMKNTGSFSWRVGVQQTFHLLFPAGHSMIPMYSTVHDGHVFKPWFTENGVDFTRVESQWVGTNPSDPSQGGTFTFWYTPTTDCYCSMFYPWNYSKDQNYINTQFSGYDYVHISQLIQSEHGRNVTLVEITDFTVPEANKYHVFVTGRQHAVESLCAPFIAGMMKKARDTPALRQGIHWYFVPEINPDGCAGVATSYVWQTWNVNTNPIIAAVKAYCQNIENSYGLDVFFDWHSLGSGFDSHILYNTGDTTGAALAAAMIAATILNETADNESYSTAVAFSYAYQTWGAASFTPEPSQSEWNVTNDMAWQSGEQMAQAIYDFYY